MYPLTQQRGEIEVPDYLAGQAGLVVFNVESGRDSDLMKRTDQQMSLRLLISECVSKGLGIVVLAPSMQIKQL